MAADKPKVSSSRGLDIVRALICALKAGENSWEKEVTISRKRITEFEARKRK